MIAGGQKYGKEETLVIISRLGIVSIVIGVDVGVEDVVWNLGTFLYQI